MFNFAKYYLCLSLAIACFQCNIAITSFFICIPFSVSPMFKPMTGLSEENHGMGTRGHIAFISDFHLNYLSGSQGSNRTNIFCLSSLSPLATGHGTTFACCKRHLKGTNSSICQSSHAYQHVFLIIWLLFSIIIIYIIFLKSLVLYNLCCVGYSRPRH